MTVLTTAAPATPNVANATHRPKLTLLNILMRLLDEEGGVDGMMMLMIIEERSLAMSGSLNGHE